VSASDPKETEQINQGQPMNIATLPATIMLTTFAIAFASKALDSIRSDKYERMGTVRLAPITRNRRPIRFRIAVGLIMALSLFLFFLALSTQIPFLGALASKLVPQPG
jgi:uncharacterized membrane protein (DUF485 family)